MLAGMFRLRNTLKAAAVLSCLIASPVVAEDLVIGVREAPVSPDPHWITTPTNFQLNSQIYEPLVRRDDDAIPRPWLAESWDTPDDKTWIFHLRRGVKWHDGSPFTAEDVVYTYTRIKSGVPNSPAPYTVYVGPIKSMEIVDPLTLKITTIDPAPALLEKLGYVLLVSKKSGEAAKTEDYNAGKAVIGTGPYKFVSWAVNDNTVLAKNPDYWGEKEPWDKVTYKVIANDPARVAALLAKDIDVMETVPSQDIARLKANPDVAVWSRLTGRTAFLTFDIAGALDSGKVTGPNGEKLDKNPLADAKVREALVLAIDREAFIKRIYEGEAEPTNQYLPKGAPGFSAALPPAKADAVRAKQLLEESGWAGKFKMDLAVAQAFFPQSVQTAEAIAQSWTRIGAPTTVGAVPYAIYMRDRAAGKMPISISAFQNSTMNGDGYYPTMLHTRDVPRGYGALNSSRYSNPEVDKLIEFADRTADRAQRNKAFEDIARIALADNGHIPLWFFYTIHATKKSLTLKSRADSHILPMNIRKVEAGK